jgi:hypothetical protein
MRRSGFRSRRLPDMDAARSSVMPLTLSDLPEAESGQCVAATARKIPVSSHRVAVVACWLLCRRVCCLPPNRRAPRLLLCHRSASRAIGVRWRELGEPARAKRDGPSDSPRLPCRTRRSVLQAGFSHRQGSSVGSTLRWELVRMSGRLGVAARFGVRWLAQGRDPVYWGPI